jgi:hypothetical protein
VGQDSGVKDLDAEVQEAIDSAPQDAEVANLRAVAWTGGKPYVSKPRPVDLISRRALREFPGPKQESPAEST